MSVDCQQGGGCLFCCFCNFCELYISIQSYKCESFSSTYCLLLQHLMPLTRGGRVGRDEIMYRPNNESENVPAFSFIFFYHDNCCCHFLA